MFDFDSYAIQPFFLKRNAHAMPLKTLMDTAQIKQHLRKPCTSVVVKTVCHISRFNLIIRKIRVEPKSPPENPDKRTPYPRFEI